MAIGLGGRRRDRQRQWRTRAALGALLAAGGLARGDLALVARPPHGSLCARQRPAVGAVQHAPARPPVGRIWGVGCARWLGLAGGMISLGSIGGGRLPPAWRPSTPGRGQPVGARGRRPPNNALQVDRLNRADFGRPGAVHAGSIQRGRLLQPAPERHRWAHMFSVAIGS
jgi:hypothetical protein